MLVYKSVWSVLYLNLIFQISIQLFSQSHMHTNKYQINNSKISQGLKYFAASFWTHWKWLRNNIFSILDPLHRNLSARRNLLNHTRLDSFLVLNWPRKISYIKASFNQMTFRGHPVSCHFRNHWVSISDEFLSKINFDDFLIISDSYILEITRLALLWALKSKTPFFFTKKLQLNDELKRNLEFYSLSYSLWSLRFC